MSVNSFNEWDPLEEVIVGTAQGCSFPSNEPGTRAIYSWDDEQYWGDGSNSLSRFCQRIVGRVLGYYRDGQFEGRACIGQAWIDRMEMQLDNLARVLANEGCTVRRADAYDHEKAYSTPDWGMRHGNAAFCPRDTLIVVGDEIIEATMGTRGRYFEVNAYKRLLKEYFKGGARWTACPKPTMEDASFRWDYPDKLAPEREVYAREGIMPITEFEPLWEAADCMRCGKDMFFQKSMVTNEFGIEWFRRHVGSEYRVHTVTFPDDTSPLHIDASLVPLRPGLVVANPDRPCAQIDIFKNNGWQVVNAPTPHNAELDPLGRCSWWLSMNVLSIDDKRVLVEASEKETMERFASLGMKPIPCPLQEMYALAGSFHCCTLDVRRRGGLQSYFPTLDLAEETAHEANMDHDE